VIEAVHKHFPDIHAHHTLAPRSMEDLLSSAASIHEVPILVRRDLHTAADEMGAAKYIVTDEDYPHIPAFLSFFHRYRDAIAPLPADP